MNAQFNIMYHTIHNTQNTTKSTFPTKKLKKTHTTHKIITSIIYTHMSLSNPYFNTYLYTTVTLQASQMNNDIYKHLKENLIRKLEGRCYGKYGFVSKVYKIEERTGGNIVPEDPMASAVYNIKFSCKLCRPLKETVIVCRVATINDKLICLKNGPIAIFIFSEIGNINIENFYFDNKRNVLIAYLDEQKTKGVQVNSGDYVKVKIMDVRLEDKTNRIIVIGTLESMATTKERDDSIRTEERDDLKFMTHDEYMSGEAFDKIVDSDDELLV